MSGQTRTRWVAAVLAVIVVAPASGQAVDSRSPKPVSPGGAERMARVGSACPTFSWTAGRDARRYDLAIYEVSDIAGQAREILTQSVPGGATTWTPSLDQCLEPGDRYAWSVRAVDGKGVSEWSTPSLFQVAAAPSEAELEAALAIVRRYLTAESEADSPISSGPTNESGEARSEEVQSASQPTLAAPAAPELTVDGGVVASSFTGDGSTLTALDPANLAAGTAAIDISGEAASAATATDSQLLDGIDSAAFLQGTALDTEAELETLLSDVQNVLTDTETAATAAALAADGVNCDADQAAGGIDAAGNAQSCRSQADLTGIAGLKSTRVGRSALLNNTTGTRNTANGTYALFFNTEGVRNSALGAYVLFYNTVGSNNTASGADALSTNSTGSDNTASGAFALTSNTTGSDNTASGAYALASNRTGYLNTASGVSALRANTTGSDNTASGTSALRANFSGSYNTAAGADALRSNTTGGSNTATGRSALRSNTIGRLNTASGVSALFDNVSGYRNTASGFSALANNTSGFRNTAVGNRAGFKATTGDDNIFIGSGAEGVAGEGNTIRIGGTTVGIGDGQQNRTFINGIFEVGVTGTVHVLYIDSNGQIGQLSSSRRYKEEIADIGSVSERLLELRPVTYRYRRSPEEGDTPIEFGLIAEEVAEAFPELVVYNEAGQPETVKYHLLSALLLNELQKQEARLERLEAAERRRPLLSAVESRTHSSPAPGTR